MSSSSPFVHLHGSVNRNLAVAGEVEGETTADAEVEDRDGEDCDESDDELEALCGFKRPAEPKENDDLDDFCRSQPKKAKFGDLHFGNMEADYGGIGTVSYKARLLVVYLLLQYITETKSQDDCPCVHCGPPMCQPFCKLNCAKCCTCCVYFGARIGKRSNHYSRWEAKGLLDINKREPHKEISLRLSILHKSEEHLYGNKKELTVDDTGSTEPDWAYDKNKGLEVVSARPEDNRSRVK